MQVYNLNPRPQSVRRTAKILNARTESLKCKSGRRGTLAPSAAPSPTSEKRNVLATKRRMVTQSQWKYIYARSS